jgi:hypothetical protein
MGAVIRLCHTIAFASGRPLERSHSTTVSRWLVMPTAATSPRGLAQDLARGAQLGRPDRLRVVLDVARRRIELRELALRGGGHRARVIEEDRAAGRGSLIEGENESRHREPPQNPSARNATAPITPPAMGPRIGTQA